MIKEHDRAVLTADVPEHALQAGDIGTVVAVLGGGEAYLVEFFTVDGETIDVVYVESAQVRPAGNDEVAHARPLAAPQATGD